MIIPEVARALCISKNLACAPKNEDSSSPLAEAMAFLKEELTGGPIDASMIWKAARDDGLTVITVKRAKVKVGVITRRVGATGKRGGGKYIWELPKYQAKGSIQVKDDLGYQGNHIKENDTLNNISFKDVPVQPDTDTLNIESTSNPIMPIDRREAILGMPVDRAIEIWRSKRSPVFALGQDTNCRDMKRLLANPDCAEHHLKAVRAWFDKL